MARGLTNRVFSVSNFCDFPLSGRFPDQFFLSCQKRLLSLLSSVRVRLPYSCLILSLVRAHASLQEATTTERLQHKENSGQPWPLAEHSGSKSGCPSHKCGHPLISFPHFRRPNAKRFGTRSERQRGHAVETFKKILLNYSGMSAKSWVNLSCVTGKRITLLLKWESKMWPQ